MLQKFYLHFIVLEFILFSGSVCFFIADPKRSMITFLLSAIIGLLINRFRLTNSLKFNFKLCLPIIIWTIINVFIISNNIRNSSYLAYIIYPLSCSIIISYIDYKHFKRILYYYMYILTSISIIVQLLHDYFGLSGSTHTIADKVYTMNFYLFNTGWGENRLASIFWEPGQFQVVIFYFLCLYINDIKNERNWKNILYKYGIFIIAIIMTKSTTGYMVLGLFTAYLSVSVKSKQVSFKKTISVLFSLILIFVILKSELVKDKVINIQDAESYSSAGIRLSDNLSCLRLAIENPILGSGIAGTKTLYILQKYGNETSSNGWLYVAACFGFLYLLYILFYLFKGIKRLYLSNDLLLFGKYEPIIIFSILFITQCNEGYIILPYMWMYIFKFKSYYN